MVRSYRRYIKELESLVSEKNRELFQKIRDLDLVISGEEFMVDVNIMPAVSRVQSKTSYGYSYSPGIEKKSTVVNSKITKVSSSAMKK